MVRNEGDPLLRVMVCPPGSEYGAPGALDRHHFLALPNISLAQSQHEAFRGVLRDHGVDVVSVAELPGHPNSVFTRDPLLMTPAGYVLLRMGLDSRRGEEAWLAQHVERVGIPAAGSIEVPGTVEGGDVILGGDVAFVGSSTRTNAEGIRQLQAILGRQGFEVRVAPIPDHYLHIGGAMSLIAPRRVVACAGVFPPQFFAGFDVIWVQGTTATGANVICLEPNRVIAEAQEIALIRALEEARVHVIPLDLSEFVKGGGGPTCLIQPLRRENRL